MIEPYRIPIKDCVITIPPMYKRIGVRGFNLPLAKPIKSITKHKIPPKINSQYMPVKNPVIPKATPIICICIS